MSCINRSISAIHKMNEMIFKVRHKYTADKIALKSFIDKRNDFAFIELLDQILSHLIIMCYEPILYACSRSISFYNTM